MRRLLSFFLMAILLLALAACASELAAPTEAAATTEIAATEKALLDLPYDKNGVYYLERARTTEPEEEIRHPSPYSFTFDSLCTEDFTQLVYATVRVKFQYAGQDWMIQMWKGRYALAMLGGEIAVLKKPAEQQAEHYWPALQSEELGISMEVYQHNFIANGTKHLFMRAAKSAWWFNGFVPGSFYEYNKKSEIIMVGTITFPDREMLEAFEESFVKIGFKSGAPDSWHPETYAVKDNALTFSWQNIDQDA